VEYVPRSPLQAIRAHCLDCCAGSAQEVAKCMALNCPSWDFRMGANPYRKPPSDEQRQAMQERGRRLAKANKSLRSDAQDHGTEPSLPTRPKPSKIDRLSSPEMATADDPNVVMVLGKDCAQGRQARDRRAL
jgi:hypothetical protein